MYTLIRHWSSSSSSSISTSEIIKPYSIYPSLSRLRNLTSLINSLSARTMQVSFVTLTFLIGCNLGATESSNSAPSDIHVDKTFVFPDAEPNYVEVANGSSFNVDVSNREDSRRLYRDVFQHSSNNHYHQTFDIDQCVQGINSTAHLQSVLTRINYYRAMAGIPADIKFSSNLNDAAMQAALMMAANNRLSHSPNSDWPCYTSNGRYGASRSNLALGTYGVNAIDAYIEDFGNGNTAVGHRRWILFPPTNVMGSGDVGRANAIFVINDDTPMSWPNTRDEFVSWPPAGYVPENVVYPRWSFSVNDANFSQTVVTMSHNNTAISLDQYTPTNGFGANTIVWETSLTKSNYTDNGPIQVAISNVIVDGVYKDYQYSVYLFDSTTGTTPTSRQSIGFGGPLRFTVGEAVSFSGISSYDNDGEIISYNWTSTAFDTNINAEQFEYVFTTSGSFVISLTVTDNEGLKHTSHKTIVIENEDSPTANAGPDIVTTIGEKVIFDGGMSSDRDGNISSYKWTSSAFSSALFGSSVEYQFAQSGEFLVTLEVTDDSGNRSTDSLILTVETESGSGPSDPTPTDPSPTLPPESKYPSMFLRGSMNSWSTSLPMTLIDSNLWAVTFTTTKSSGESFKFDVYGDWRTNFGGGSGSSGYARARGANIPLSLGSGAYEIQFNDATLKWTQTIAPPQPTAPVANAGRDTTVEIGQPFTLTGAASTDINNDIARYEWYLAGQKIHSSVNYETTLYTTGSYTYILEVTDQQGLTNQDSVTVNVIEEQLTSKFPTMHLVGTHNSWNISTSPMTLVQDNIWEIRLDMAANNQFKFVPTNWSLSFGDRNRDGRADSNGGGNIFITNGAGKYVIRFNDQTLYYEVDKDNGPTPPTARISVSVSNSEPNQEVIFDGSGSSDDGPLSYLWDNGETSPSISRVFSSEGDYIINLTVTDEDGLSDSTAITISVRMRQNTPPKANAGIDSTEVLGNIIRLDGSGSTDDVAIVSFAWYLDDTEQLLGTDEVINWLPEQVGSHTVRLDVIDSDGASSSDIINITINELPTTKSIEFSCNRGNTYFGQNVYVVGSSSLLGNWNPARAVKLSPSNYPTWNGVIDGFEIGENIQWKCIKRDGSRTTWQNGANNSIRIDTNSQRTIGSF